MLHTVALNDKRYTEHQRHVYLIAYSDHVSAYLSANNHQRLLSLL